MIGKTIQQLHSDLRKGTTTSLQVLETALAKVNELRNLNAFVEYFPGSRACAEASHDLFRKGEPKSVLEGVPIAVKDNFCVRNVKTTCASKMLENFKPTYTATVVDKLLKSGAVLIGKTNMDEFAMGSGTIRSIYGPTKNVWGFQNAGNSSDDSNWFISGGSSGGSAVAVASGMCLGALGSDTGGSTRNPASYCGVVGLKPTYGLLSRHGLIPLVNSMDVPGILTNNVEDAFILLKLMAGHDEKDSTTVEAKKLGELNPEPSVKGLKIGLPVEYNPENLSEEVRSTWKRVGKLLEEGGAQVEPMSMPHTKYSNVCYSVLNQCEVASNMAKYDGIEFGSPSHNNVSVKEMMAETRTSNFNDVVKQRILTGNYFLLQGNYETYFVKAMQIRRLIMGDFTAAWNKGYDLLLTPTTLTDAPKFSDFLELDEREQCAREDYCTQPANMSGCPAVSIPVELSRQGLPLSIQLMAPNFEDQKMLEAALYIEKLVEFHRHR